MSLVSSDFMGRNPPKLPNGESLGEAFAAVVKKLFGTDTRAMSQQLGFDRKSVENVRLGRAGAPLIARALLARQQTHDDAWEVADAILERVLGESRSQYEERKLREHIEKTQNAISLHEERKARRAALAEGAAAVDARLARIAASLDRGRAR